VQSLSGAGLNGKGLEEIVDDKNVVVHKILIIPKRSKTSHFRIRISQVRIYKINALPQRSPRTPRKARRLL
jgi:hypothetical protein